MTQSPTPDCALMAGPSWSNLVPFDKARGVPKLPFPVAFTTQPQTFDVGELVGITDLSRRQTR